MKKRVLAMLLAVVMIVSVFAACGNGGSANSSSQADTSSASTDSTPAEESSTPAETSDVSTGPDDTSETYAFTVYYNYTGWTRKWGVDEASKYMSEKFNVDVNWYGPDSDPDAKLNLMVSSDDLPESIVMERGSNNIKLANAGVLVPLQPYMYEGNNFEKYLAPATIDLLKINGQNYGVPNWARTGATGGNYQWMFDTATWEAMGSPEFTTLEDIHDYALKVKDANLTSYTGEAMIPVLFRDDPEPGSSAYYVWWPFYRALGAPNLLDVLYTQENGKIDFITRSETVKKAFKYANQWYNEGLFSADAAFTDNHDMFKEKLSNGRGAVVWYDFSQDDGENFRRTIRENSGESTSIEVLGSEYFQPDAPMFPGLEGTTYVYGDENGTIGWNVNCITKKAERPQRIFDLFTWMISDEGSVNMMYGPEGGTMLESVEYKDGEMPAVKLYKPQSAFTTAETDAAGAWFWSQPANSDYVDGVKFAYNDTLDEADRNWVVAIQAHLCSFNDENPRIGQKFITDQLTNVNSVIDDQSDEGVARQTILDQCRAQCPKIIMASSDEEFEQLWNDLNSFAESQGVDNIIAAYQEKFDENVATQGFNAYDESYDVYRAR